MKKRTLYDGLVLLLDNFARLLCVKTFISFTVILALVWGFIHDKVSSDVFYGVVSAVITYFFTKKSDEKGQR